MDKNYENAKNEVQDMDSGISEPKILSMINQTIKANEDENGDIKADELEVCILSI